MKITLEDKGRRLEYQLGEHVTWCSILEEAVFPGLLGLGYFLPPTEKLMEAIELAWDEDVDASEDSGDAGRQ